MIAFSVNSIALLYAQPIDIDLMAICTLVIALISLGMSIYFGWLQHRHNKNGVTPVPDLVTSSDCIYSTETGYVVEGCIGVKLLNKGVGPLHITKFRMKYKNKEFTTANELFDSENLLQCLSTTSFALDGHWVSPNEEIMLLEVRIFRNDHEQGQKHIINFLKFIQFELNYECIYETKRFKEFKIDIL